MASIIRQRFVNASREVPRIKILSILIIGLDYLSLPPRRRVIESQRRSIPGGLAPRSTSGQWQLLQLPEPCSVQRHSVTVIKRFDAVHVLACAMRPKAVQLFCDHEVVCSAPLNSGMA